MTSNLIPEGFAPGDAPYSSLIGPLLYKYDTGPDGRKRGWVGLLLEDRHIGGNGRGHGGLMLTLLDEAMGMNAYFQRDEMPTVTISMQANFLGATVPGQFVMATASIQKITATMAFMEGKVWSGETLAGTGTGVWKYLKKRS